MEQIRLDIIPKGLMPVCHSSQYDKGRVIRLNLVDGLQGYTLTDETVTLNVRKPDNNIVTAGVTVVSGASYVDIVTTEQMTACEGENLCEIVITKGDVKIASLNFKMKVEVDPLKDGIESETEIHNLETQIAEIDAEIVPPIVAEEVANQYDSENVIFDDTPTENHGTGYTVTSEGIKNYVDNKPNALVDLTDVDIDNPTSNQALVWDTTEQKWINGEVSTVGGLNDLNDVTIDDESLEQGQELVYNNTAEVFENKTTRVELTQAEYNALANPLPDVDYYIIDAPSMQGTSADLSYDGGTDSTHDVIQAIRDMIYPVGSIYMSVTDNTVAKVEARFGGTWVAFGAGRTLVGVNANETEFNSVEKTGGEKKHTLNRSEIPSHNHGIGLNQTGSVHFTGFWHLKLTTGTDIKNTNADETIGDTATNFDGGGQAHNNLQPYVTVYMYKRTA